MTLCNCHHFDFITLPSSGSCEDTCMCLQYCSVTKWKTFSPCFYPTINNSSNHQNMHSFLNLSTHTSINNAPILQSMYTSITLNIAVLILLNIMLHALMGRFQLELIYYFTYFSTVVPSNICVFLSYRPFVVNTAFSTGLVSVEVGQTRRQKNLQHSQDLLKMLY